MPESHRIKRVQTEAPGWIVFGMLAVWLAPLWVRDLIEYPIVSHWNSHLLYAVLFGMALLGVLALNSLELATGFWSRSGIWLRVLGICGGYASMMTVSLVTILTLDSARVLHYYGGDAGGSPGLLIVPSVIAYCVLGVVLAGVAALLRIARR
jgi:hypothetical protein